MSIDAARPIDPISEPHWSPGSPDLVPRRRFLRADTVLLKGRAWSGWSDVPRVDVSADGGGPWRDAELEPSSGPPAHAGLLLGRQHPASTSW